MLYVARCIKCNHLLKSEDVKLFKEYMAGHLRKSHKTKCELLERHIAIHQVKTRETPRRNHAYSYQDTVRTLPLSEFEDFHFQIMRVRNPVDIRALNRDWKSPTFWHTYRNLCKLALATP